MFPSDVRPRDYAAEPLPSPADDRVRAFVVSEDVAGERMALTTEAEWVLIAFASRMASLAVRERSDTHVKAGLGALALIRGKVDLRDAIIYLSILHDAALRIGADADAIFRSFADSGGPMVPYITAFPARKAADKAIAAMGFRRSRNRSSHTGRTGERAMLKIAAYWRLVFLPFVLLSLWTAHVCVTQFEPVRRAIVMGTVLAIVLVVALVLICRACGYGRPSRYRDVPARTGDRLPASQLSGTDR